MTDTETSQLRHLPDSPGELLAALPDTPRWLYARSLLRSGSASVQLGPSNDAALIADDTTAVLVGRADPDLLRDGLAGGRSASALLVHDDATAAARAALPNWSFRRFVVHAFATPVTSATAAPWGVIVSMPVDPVVLAGFPADIRTDAADAPAAAIRIVAGHPVAVCAVSDLTETWWDVGIDTVPTARRQGHATAVFTALAATMAAQGRQPIWAAYEDYPPSLALAARLGFRPMLRMGELTWPAAGSDT